MKQTLFTLIFGLFISVFSFGQSCGVDHTHHTTYDSPADRAWEHYVQYIQNDAQLRSNGEMIQLTVAFSQTQSLADQVGLTALMDYYTEMIDSVNAINQRSGLLVHWTIYEDNSLSVGLSTGDIAQVIADTRNEVPPYDVINDRKRCKEIHVNIHVVEESYSPSNINGIAGQGKDNGLALHRANIVIKYNTAKKYFTYLTAHELGHVLGMYHEDGTAGAFDYSHAYFNLDGSFGTIMYSTYLGAMFQGFVYSGQDSLYQDYPTGDADHDNTTTGNAVAPLIATYFDFDYAVHASQTTVCAGESVDLELITDKGDDFDWSGQFLTPDGATAVFQSNIPGNYDIIGLTKNSSDGSCVWKADTVSITVLDHEYTTEEIAICTGETAILADGTEVTDAGEYEVILNQQASNGCDRIVTTTVTIFDHEVKDSIFIITTNQTISLPDGTILTDQDHGKTGSYTIEGGAANGCDLTINWVVDVVSATIDVAETDAITIFPNPTTDGIRIQIDGIDIQTITAFDIVGRRLTMITAPMGSIDLDVSDWMSGAYFLILHDKDGNVYRAKILKE